MTTCNRCRRLHVVIVIERYIVNDEAVEVMLCARCWSESERLNAPTYERSSAQPCEPPRDTPRDTRRVTRETRATPQNRLRST